MDQESPDSEKKSFIMVTSNNEKSYLMNALQSGVTSYLVKPFTVVGLIQRVMSVVSQLERREFERFYSDRPVSLKFKENQLDGNLIDISLGGLLGTFKRKLPTGAFVRKSQKNWPGSRQRTSWGKAL